MRVLESSLAEGEVIQRFRPTTGAAVGWSGLAMLVIVMAYCLLEVHTVVGLRVVLGCLLGAVVLWVTQFRPRVTAYDRGLLLLGSILDTLVPYSAVDDVRLGQTLVVRSGGRRFTCVGIGQSLGADMRRRLRATGHGNTLDLHRNYVFAGEQPSVDQAEPGMTYHEFVMTRINELLVAHPRAAEDARPPVRRAYALPEIAALLVTGVAFVVSLLL
jgi:hypothetical protein